MRTTIRLRDDLLTRAKRKAAEEGRTLTSLVEEGLTLVLSLPKEPHQRRVELIVSKVSGGLQAGVDLNSNRSLLELMEGG